MEDREFQLEKDKFTFERAKYIEDLSFQSGSALFKQIFALNIGILTLIFLIIYHSFNYSFIPLDLSVDTRCIVHCLLILAIILSSLSIWFLIMLYTNSVTNFQIQLDAVFITPSDNIKEDYDNRQKKNKKLTDWSHRLLLSSWILVFLVMCCAIFTIDFSKAKSKGIDTTISNDMQSSNPQQSNSATPNLIEKSLEPRVGSAFAMATLGQHNITPTQQTQPAVSNSQPQPNNNNQNSNR